MGDPLLRLLLVPAPIPRDEDQDHPPESILLDPYGYISARDNCSTAEGYTRYKMLIRVTFWPATPPRVSCFTIHCPKLKPFVFANLPKILTTEDDLVLLRVAISFEGSPIDPNSNDYFVYQAGAKNKRPSLHPITMPPHLEFSDRDLVLLCCRARGMFFVAMLRRASNRVQFNVHLYNSEARKWSTRLMYPPKCSEFSHTSKVTTIGGELGSVGWVDLWRGILIYDVLLEDNHHLRYIPLLSPIVPKELKGSPLFIRDIIVVNGYIKFFDMNAYIKPGSEAVYTVTGYTYTPDGWEAATQKLNLSKKDSTWETDCYINISQVPVNDAPCARMLPVLQEGEEPTLTRLHAGYPVLSLHDDGVVYIMNTLEPHDDKAWVIAVDMRNRALKGVAGFGSGRPVGYGFTYLGSGISKHLGIRSSTRNEVYAAETRSGMVRSGKQKGPGVGVLLPNCHVAAETRMSEMAHSGKQKGPMVGLLPNSDVEKTRRWEQGKDTYLNRLRMGLSKGSENGTDLHQARIKGSGD